MIRHHSFGLGCAWHSVTASLCRLLSYVRAVALVAWRIRQGGEIWFIVYSPSQAEVTYLDSAVRIGKAIRWLQVSMVDAGGMKISNPYEESVHHGVDADRLKHDVFPDKVPQVSVTDLHDNEDRAEVRQCLSFWKKNILDAYKVRMVEGTLDVDLATYSFAIGEVFE
jgi:hypothetical protein